MSARTDFPLLVIIPAYNEEESIAGVIGSVKAFHPEAQVLVVNDGSRDRTSERARATGQAKVIDAPVNLGIGGAVQTGFLYATRNNFAVAIQFDGDGQHKAEEIDTLLRALQTGQADVVIGSRFCRKGPGYRSSLSRRIGIRTFELVTLMLIRTRITDHTSGFRAYNRRAIAFLAQYYPHDYPEPEAVILLGRNGFRLQEVPTEMVERQGGRSSISGLKTLYYMVKVLLAVCINAIRPRVIGG
jgi:glycosyltransferase involved in cell wall biosynthesis